MPTVSTNNTTTYKRIKYANMHYIKYVKKKTRFINPMMYTRLRIPLPVPDSS